jgi:ElaB/YqjD/DUF883 family membrane-anchored ribosome-binding protein
MENTTFGAPLNTFGNTARDDGVLTKTTAGVHAAVNQVTDAAKNTASKAKPAIDKVAAMAHQAVDRAAASAAPAVDWIGEQGESLNATQKKLVTNTSAYIAANPLVSVSMAVLTGFLIGRVIRR